MVAPDSSPGSSRYALCTSNVIDQPTTATTKIPPLHTILVLPPASNPLSNGYCDSDEINYDDSMLQAYGSIPLHNNLNNLSIK